MSTNSAATRPFATLRHGKFGSARFSRFDSVSRRGDFRLFGHQDEDVCMHVRENLLMVSGAQGVGRQV